jgi:ribonuclease HI
VVTSGSTRDLCRTKGDRLTSSYSEEERALSLGIEWASNHPQERVAFCTDSLSLLLAIQSRNPKTDPIRRQIESLSAEVELMYVPGHKDILGNELADAYAKKAARQVGPFARDDVSMEAARSAIRGGIKDPPSHHHLIKDTYAKFSEERDRKAVKTRAQGALLAQLRSGHHKSLGYYQNLLNPEVSDKCDRCKDPIAVDDTRHWLTKCMATVVKDARARIFGHTRELGLQEIGLQPDKVLRLADETLEC